MPGEARCEVGRLEVYLPEGLERIPDPFRAHLLELGTGVQIRLS